MTISAITPQNDAALYRYALYIAATLADAARRQDRKAILSTLGRLPGDEQADPIVIIVEQTARTFGVTVEDIHSPSRRREHVDARAVVCYAARLLSYSFVAIGRHMDRDHSTVMHACGRVAETPRLRGIAQRLAEGLGWDREAAAS